MVSLSLARPRNTRYRPGAPRPTAPRSAATISAPDMRPVSSKISAPFRGFRATVAIGVAPVQGRPPTGAHRLIAGHSQYPQDVGPPIFDGAADLLQQQGLAQYQLFHVRAVDLQHGDLVEGVCPGQYRLPGQRGLAEERPFLQRADRDQ